MVVDTKASRKTPLHQHKKFTNNARIVHDQVATQNHVGSVKQAVGNSIATGMGIHENRRQLDERAFYPAHDARKESAAYAKVHKELCITKDLPCMVCGVRHSTLNDPEENPYGARAMETHHHVIEWALANAIDVNRFNKALRPNLAHRHQDEPMYQKNMSKEQIRDWVDHSEHNLWVLCDIHHRHPYLGIHEITYPIWGPQDLLSPSFEDYVRQQVMGDGNDKPPSKGKTGGTKKKKSE